MGIHLRSRFTTGEVIEVLERYLAGEIGINESLMLLNIKRRRFFKVLKNYREEKKGFVLSEQRSKPTRNLPKEMDQKILEELAEEKRLIDDKDTPVRFYNYSYVKNRLEEKYEMNISLPSIIGRAKKTDITKSVHRGNLMIERY
jgi:hypothetical protein